MVTPGDFLDMVPPPDISRHIVHIHSHYIYVFQMKSQSEYLYMYEIGLAVAHSLPAMSVEMVCIVINIGALRRGPIIQTIHLGLE